MNIRQLRCALMLAKVHSFSQAAELLDISQPALSKHIINLETELGVKLFDRSSSLVSLTPAGEYFVAEAQELIYREEQLLHAMEGFAAGEKGRLVIGLSPFRSVYLIPEVVRKLRERFPGLQVVLRELGSEQLYQGALDGHFDLAILNLPADETLLCLHPMKPESIVLAVPEAMSALVKNVRREEDGFPCVALADCMELPFVALGKQQVLRQLFDKLCLAEEVVPNIAVEAVGITTAWALVRAGAGATVLPLQFLEDEHFSKGICFYRLRQSLPVRHPAVACRKGKALSPYAEYAIELLTK